MVVSSRRTVSRGISKFNGATVSIVLANDAKAAGEDDGPSCDVETFAKEQAATRNRIYTSGAATATPGLYPGANESRHRPHGTAATAAPTIRPANIHP